jgi:SAM-dependent methyltransferase
MKESGFYDREYYDGKGKSNYTAYTSDSSPFESHCAMILSVVERMTETGLLPVLDVGCAKGYLVHMLRARGIVAYGLDWSSYAVGESPLDVRRSLVVGSVFELPFRSDSFSLGVSFDMLEHFNERSARLAIRELSRVSNMQIHQVNTGRLSEWRFEGDESHCLKMPLEDWQQLALEEGATETILCEPDGTSAGWRWGV